MSTIKDLLGRMIDKINDSSNEISQLSEHNTELTDRVKTLENNGITDNFTALLDSWKGDKWYVLGDSISAEISLTSGNTTKLYHELIKEELRFGEVVNLAESGATIGSNSIDANLNIYNQLSKVGDDADLITIFAGVNDVWTNVPLGNEEDTDITTFYGAMNKLCQTLHENHPQALVVFITPTEQNNAFWINSNTTGHTCRDFANAMIKICEKYSFDYYDANRKSGIYPHISANGNMYTADNIHLNYNGHRRLANNLTAFLFGKGNNRYFANTDEELTLSSISATYTGGKAIRGTSVNDLTGITVTAHYSDGSTANITDYILSGEILKGDNTITVNYQGKTTTFTVVGIVEKPQVPDKTIEVTSIWMNEQSHIALYVEKEELPSINNANPVWGFDIKPVTDFTVEAKANTGGYYLLSEMNNFMAGYELIGNQYITPDIVNNGDGSYTVTLSATGDATKEADKPYWCFPVNLNLKAGYKFILSNYYVEVDGDYYNISNICGAFKEETFIVS